MRKILDHLYQLSGYIAAFFMVMIGLTIVAQICGRFVGIAIDSTETAGFSMASMTFFGLAYTFRNGEHIRVTLFLRFITGSARKIFELFAIGFCMVFMSYLTYWAFDFVYFSHKLPTLTVFLPNANHICYSNKDLNFLISDDFDKSKKMRNVRTIIFHQVSRRDLCYVSENEGFRF